MSENRNEPMDRDDVATLVRLAGKRPEVPRDRAERVRAAARAQWQEEWQHRSRARSRTFRYAAVTAAAALVLLVVAFRVLPVGEWTSTGADLALHVDALSGMAWAREADGATSSERRAIEVGARIPVGSEVATDDGGRTALRLASGHSLRLDASTRIRLLRKGEIALERGAVYVDSGLGNDEAQSVIVRTPFGVIREIGTQFEVRLDESSVQVRLREGTVAVRQNGRTHEVAAGAELKLGSDGSATRRELPSHGPLWEWLVDVTPMVDLEGRTAREFLDWVARERGWILAFDGENVARLAEEIVLAGTVERLSLEQALEAVLPTCRMVHRVEDGVLVIAAEPEIETSV